MDIIEQLLKQKYIHPCPVNVNLSLQTGACRYSVKGKAGYCSNFRILPRGDEKTLQAAVASVGPVAVAVNARLRSFHLYKGGEAAGCRVLTE